MRPASSALLAAVRASHAMAVRATALSTYQEGTSPSGTDVAVMDGSVTLDATAQIRGSLDLTGDGTGWDPRPGRHVIQPYRTELFIERGVGVSGSVEWISQGYYRVQEVTQDGPGGQLHITGADRMQAIIDAKILTPVQFGATASVADVFSQLVGDVYPSATIGYDWAASSDLLGSAQTTQDDRWQFLHDLATSRGKIMFWDYRGHLVVQDMPAATTAVWEAAAGADGVLVSAQRRLSRDGVYNAVVVQGDGAGTTAAPLAVAYDANPGSPTYYYGDFGKAPYFWSSALVTDQSHAQAAAALLLARLRKLPLQVDFSAVPNPALEPLDVVDVTYAGKASDDLLLSLGQVVMPLTAAAPLTATAYNAAGLATAIGTTL